MADTEERTQIARELLGLYRDYGSADYIGEDVTQLQHALQASEQAYEEGYDSEVGFSCSVYGFLSYILTTNCLIGLSITSMLVNCMYEWD